MEKRIYEAPAVEVVEVLTEGVFCVSETGDNESFGYEKFPWD